MSQQENRFCFVVKYIRNPRAASYHLGSHRPTLAAKASLGAVDSPGLPASSRDFSKMEARGSLLCSRRLVTFHGLTPFGRVPQHGGLFPA